MAQNPDTLPALPAGACPQCGGKRYLHYKGKDGHVKSKPCPRCHGTGKDDPRFITK